jgi:type II secretory ATPase GspE/PulE/Tfp pilus assembly ATPase PilB-like protein
MTSSMNLTERRIPQSGRIEVMAKGRPIEFRVETIPTVYGESASAPDVGPKERERRHQ